MSYLNYLNNGNMVSLHGHDSTCALIYNANSALDSLAPGPQTKLISRQDVNLAEYTRIELVDDNDEAEQQNYQYYTSEKVLGRLFRAVDERSIWKDNVQSAVSTNGPSFWDHFLKWAEGKCQMLGGFKWWERKEQARGIRSA